MKILDKYLVYLNIYYQIYLWLFFNILNQASIWPLLVTLLVVVIHLWTNHFGCYNQTSRVNNRAMSRIRSLMSFECDTSRISLRPLIPSRSWGSNFTAQLQGISFQAACEWWIQTELFRCSLRSVKKPSEKITSN